MAKTKEWFDALEKALEAEVKIAGLLEHGTLIGNAREFLVQRVLKSVLPPLIHVGSGKIIDASQHQSSKQIDIILYDSRFPLLEISPGVGLYLIEGVVGTIEVKSQLTKKTLVEALENSYSVLSLQQLHVRGSNDPNVVKTIESRYGIDHNEALRKLRYEYLPSSYIFSIESKLSAETICKNVKNWFENSGSVSDGNKTNRSCLEGFCAALPRVIIAGQNVGILDDGSFRVSRLSDVKSNGTDDWGNLSPGSMTFWKIPHRYGIFLSHIWHACSARIGLRGHSTDLEFTIDRYSPLEDYSNELKPVTGHQFSWP